MHFDLPTIDQQKREHSVPMTSYAPDWHQEPALAASPASRQSRWAARGCRDCFEILEILGHLACEPLDLADTRPIADDRPIFAGCMADTTVRQHDRRQKTTNQQGSAHDGDIQTLSLQSQRVYTQEGSGGSLPEANRHYAARAQEALDAVLIAPIA